MIKFSELKKLSIDDIDLILNDQQDLYSQEEIAELIEYREYLIEQEKKAQEDERQSRRLKTIICPKCDGPNDAHNTQCTYCSYKFKESDYYAPKHTNKENTEDATDSMCMPIGRLLFGLLFSGGGVGAIIFGYTMNNSVKAQWDSFWNNGSTNPGTTWIIIGAAAAAVGVIMLMSAFLSKE